MLSNDIKASDLLIEADCCEMTICNSTKLIILLYYEEERKAIMTKHHARKQQIPRLTHPTLGFPVSNITLHLQCSDDLFLKELLLITICHITD